MRAKHLISVLLTLTAVSMLTVADPPAAELKVRLAVLDLAAGDGLKPDDGKTLAMFIRDAVVKNGQFKVMDRNQMMDVLKEQSFSQAVCDEKQCLVKAGKLLDVNRVLGGRVARFGSSWTIGLSLVDVNTGELLNTQTDRCDGPMDNLLNYASGAGLALLNLKPGTATRITAPAPAVAGQPLALDFGHGVQMELVWIPPGEFDMGSNESKDKDEKPLHHVTISRGFWMGKYEVTQEEYEAVVGRNPSDNGGARNPVTLVSWDDAQTFCRRLNGMHVLPAGVRCRLPTEAEWEYACRAGTTTRCYAGDSESELGRAGWYSKNSRNSTHPVGQKEPNRFGLYDMLGNVWEWCADWLGSYTALAVTDPTGSANGDGHVLRGGSYHDSANVGASGRGVESDSRNHYIGLRVCCSGGP